MSLKQLPLRKLLLKDASLFEQGIIVLLYVAVLGAFIQSMKDRKSDRADA